MQNEVMGQTRMCFTNAYEKKNSDDYDLDLCASDMVLFFDTLFCQDAHLSNTIFIFLPCLTKL